MVKGTKSFHEIFFTPNQTRPKGFRMLRHARPHKCHCAARRMFRAKLIIEPAIKDFYSLFLSQLVQ